MTQIHYDNYEGKFLGGDGSIRCEDCGSNEGDRFYYYLAEVDEEI